MNGPPTKSDGSAFARESANENVGIRLPFSVRIIARTYIVCGVLSAVDILIELARGEINLNLGVLGIFIGRGLLKRKNGWRRCAVVLSRFSLACGGLTVLVAIPLALISKLAHTSGQSLASFYASIFVMVALLAFSVWQYRVLTRSDIEALFLQKELPAADGSDSPGTSRFQYSLGTLMLVTVVAALVCWRLCSEDVLYDDVYGGTRIMAAGESCWSVEYGGRTHRFFRRSPILDFVVFAGSRKGGPLTLAHPRPVRKFGWISEKPDRTIITFPGKVQLVEIIDGEYRESDQRVSSSQLEAFLNSSPDSYTIDTLLQFVREHQEIE